MTPVETEERSFPLSWAKVSFIFVIAAQPVQDFLYVLKNDLLLKEMNQNAFKVTHNHMTPHNHKGGCCPLSLLETRKALK